MTLENAPLYTMTLKAGNALMGDLERAMQATARTQAKTKAGFQNWKAVVNTPKDTQAAQLGEAGMIGFFLDFLFGMPLFSGMSDMSQGIAQMALMNHGEENRKAPTMARASDLNALMAAQRNRYGQALSGQNLQAAQMKQMRQMIMLMMMTMMAAGGDTDEGSGGNGEGDLMMAPDVLRHPKLARFKQNRHSLSCIREMFQSQAGSVAPRFNAPRCEAA